jgi:hypothetical protein
VKERARRVTTSQCRERLRFCERAVVKFRRATRPIVFGEAYLRMLPITRRREFIARSTKMPRSSERSSVSALSHRDPSSVVFIITAMSLACSIRKTVSTVRWVSVAIMATDHTISTPIRASRSCSAGYCFPAFRIIAGGSPPRPLSICASIMR